MKKLVLTGGGTGGHIYPAISVLEALRAQPGAVGEVRFFGPENRGERAMVERYGLRFESVPAAPIRGRGPLALVRSFARLGWGAAVATRRLLAFRPGVVFSTGGYASFPCCVAARLLRKPVVVYLPDVSPGWAVKAEMRLATRLATTTEAALNHLPRRKTTVTGYPVRPAFFEHTRAEARQLLGIPAEAKVLLIAGASQGATAINSAVFKGVRGLLNGMTVTHITGAAGYDEARGFESQLGRELDGRYHPSPFREDLPALMIAADLAVMRAGASTLGELTAAGLPAVLVPGAFAGGHQRANAKWLADAGAAVVLEEKDLGSLCDMVENLMADEPRLAAMRAAALGLARPNAARDIANLILEVAK